MAQHEQPSRVHFDVFDLDLRTRELRKDGRPVRLQDQPAKLLVLLASRAGELVTRSEIEKALWGEDEFVEFEHGINTAMRKIREALGDDLEKPRFIETLPRKGYRFIASVETQSPSGPANGPQVGSGSPGRSFREKIPGKASSTAAALSVDQSQRVPEPNTSLIESPDSAAIASSNPSSSGISDLNPSTTATQSGLPFAPSAAPEFALPWSVARTLFLTIQVGYLVMYAATLYKAEAADDVLAIVLAGRHALSLPAVLVLAMCGIAVRMYLITSVGLNHPEAGQKYRRLFPIVFIFDTIWAASPLLLIRKLGLGLALGSIAALAYLPFAQRTLMQSIYPLVAPASRQPKALS
ncbi:MAG: winged helix-turn-helix transcriptional regulator [Acidobacteria bacterium]|nr:winged helix-turn-helix transcriptional regulator [Acidobacteriota bacterium]